MSRTLSESAVTSLMAAETDKVWLVLCTISHPDLTDDIRVVANTENITSRGLLFIGCPFELELPGETQDGPGEATLRIDNIDRVIVKTIRTIQSLPLVTLEIVLADQPDTVEFQLQNMTLRDASYDAGVVSGRLRFEDIVLEPIAEVITPARFPGLF